MKHIITIVGLICLIASQITCYADAATRETGFWNVLWGKAAEPTTVYGGMWSYHFLFLTGDSAGGQGHNDNNPSLSLASHGLFVGTFVNTYAIQSYAFGIQRYWWDTTFGNDWHYSIGYRLGLIYGYAQTGRWGTITKYQPFLPFPQIISELNWKQVGVQLGYTADVISAMFYMRF